MAHYTYKDAAATLPAGVESTEYYRATVCGCDAFCDDPCEYDGNVNYDGHMWAVTAEYVSRLKTAAEAVYADPSEANRAALRLALDGAMPPVKPRERAA